jgi:hypothetical protein
MGVLNYAPEPRTPMDCPHCGNPAMSAGAKLWLGPARTVKCRSCGQRVSVAWGRSALMLSLAFGPLFVFHLVRFLLGAATPQWVYPVTMAAMIVGIIAMLLLYAKFVPLVKR